ncbi:sigma-54 interaction domain-containing protein [Bacillus testis]|uniref:sigma-54 interaction domain-containing protein n=1 Tax=Bacillus testis TaxID=1622072 RepID=UPI00067EC8B5|nr:sigma-54-dependent Fis family transcriptional regulator [Bacillus testis]
MDEMTLKSFHYLLDSIDEGIHAVDLQGRTIVYNKFASFLDGMEVKEVMGKHILEAFPSLTSKTSTLLQVIKTGKPVRQLSQSYVNLHGRKIDTINTTLPIIADGVLIAAVEVAKDFSRIRELSERLLDSENRSRRPKKRTAGKGTVYRFSDIKSNHPRMLNEVERARKAARSSSSVLVYGESGTGKELFVQGIHQASGRENGPFIAQNCAALPESLLESLLFGTTKGSYTGAVDRPGLFELADRGTLFLDEIQSMSLGVQAKLLRVLEDGMIRRIGGTSSVKVDVRVIAAMNMPPTVALQEKIIRPDLFYRLNVLSFRLPPLRERKGDVLLLCRYFIDYFNEILGMEVAGMTAELEKRMEAHDWPGNIRELKHCLEYMMNQSEAALLDCGDLPPALNNNQAACKSETLPSLREALKEKEQELIKSAISQAGGNVQKAARMLQIPRQTLQYKLKRLEE